MHVNPRHLALAFFVISLAGCGDWSWKNSNTQLRAGNFQGYLAPYDNAVSAFWQMDQSYSLAGTDSSGNDYTVEYTITPGHQETFNGTSAFTAKRVIAIRENGIPLIEDVTTKLLLFGPFTQIADFDDTTGEVIVYTQQTPLPKLNPGNGFGTLDNGTIYSDHSLKDVVGQKTDLWYVPIQTSSTGSLGFNVLNIQSSLVSPLPKPDSIFDTEQDTFIMDSRGNIVSLNIVLQINGESINFS